MDKLYTLTEAATRLRVCAKTLSEFLKAHPAEPPLCARLGRKFIISESDLHRIYEEMKLCLLSSGTEKARPTTTYAAPSEAKVFLKLRALTTK